MNITDSLGGRRRELNFTTSLLQEECARRLAKAVPHLQRSPWQGFSLAGGLYGYMKVPIFVLWDKVPLFQNPGQLFYYGRLTPSRGGTTIKGYFDINLSSRIFMLFWMTGGLLLLLGITFLPQSGPAVNKWPGIRTSLLLLSAGGGMFGGFIWLGTRGQPHVVEFIQSTLEATPQIAEQ
jgi:hypothetical protein